MSKLFNNSLQRIQNVLSDYKITSEIVTFSDSTRTAQNAADAIGCLLGQIVKSLVFHTIGTKQPLLILVSGSNRVNEEKIEKVINDKIVKADADFTRSITGFAIGGVPPFAHNQYIKTFIDEDLLQYSELWAAAGTPHTVFCISPSELIKITNGTIISVK